jgi:hypothetical protein
LLDLQCPTAVARTKKKSAEQALNLFALAVSPDDVVFDDGLESIAGVILIPKRCRWI